MLEDKGIILRKRVGSGKRYEYQLTPSGKALAPVLTELGRWGFRYARESKTVGLFLTSSAIDLVSKNGLDHTQVHPMEGVRDPLESFMARGGDVWACPPCTEVRGYDADNLIDGVVIHGASVIMERIGKGAAALTF